MKNKLLVQLIFAISITIILSGFYPPNTSVGVLTKIIKVVEYKAFETEDWDDARNGSILYDGDEIRTGKRSLALLKFLDNSLLRVRESSIVTLFGTKEESKINKNAVIQDGSVGFEIEDQGEAEFKFTTPTAVASIRGTSGYFEVDNTSTLLYVDEGSVEIQSNEGDKKTAVVNENEFATVRIDGTLEVQTATDVQKQRYSSLEKDEVKRIIIKTKSGEEYILEYLD